MGLNLNALANATVVSEKMYNISIDGVDFGTLNEANTEKLIAIIKGMQNTTTTTKSLNTTVSKQSKQPKESPDLGEATYDKFDYCTVYRNRVRLGNKGYVFGKKFNALSQTLRNAGAKYNSKDNCWDFETVKACNAWIKAQIEYDKKNSK